MADIILNTGITSFTDGNNYIVEDVLDYSSVAINSSGSVGLTINKGGKILNTSINSAGDISVFINTIDVAFNNVSFAGTYVQKSKIITKSTTSLENYSLPVGFKIETLFFQNQGDKGGSDFELIPYISLDHKKHLYPFIPVGTVNPVFVYAQKDKYFVETLGIISNDETKIDSNARILEKHLGRSHILKFDLGTYYVRDVNMDECKDWLGNLSNHYTANIEGSNNEQSEDSSRTYIVTNGGNFIFSVSRYSFRVDFKTINIQTSLDLYSASARTQARTGYAMTRFTALPVAGVGTPVTSAELCLSTYKVTFYGFQAAFYSGEWSTNCSIKSTKFLGCRYGFYSRLSSNLSLFEDLQIHQCAFGITAGGTNCVLRRVELTPENWYRDAEAVATPFFYGYRSNDGFQNCVIQDLYLEDYLGDIESRAKFIVYKLSAASQVIFKNCHLQAIEDDTSAYHLEIFKNGTYAGTTLKLDTKIADFIEGSVFPTKVRTTEDWVLSGIAKNGSFGFSKQTYAGTTFQFFSGKNLLHFWRGVPALVSDLANGYQLKLLNSNHKYYDAITQSNTVATNINSSLHHEPTGIFYSPFDSLYMKLSLKMKGTTLINRPFVLKIANLEFTITPYEVQKGIFQYDFKHYSELSSEDFNGPNTNFKIFIKKVDLEGELLNNSDGKLITVQDFEFNLYE